MTTPYPENDKAPYGALGVVDRARTGDLRNHNPAL